MEKGITKNEIIQELFRSEHGDYNKYMLTAKQAAKEEPEFLAHLIAYNHVNGQIRDSKIALPVGSLTVPTFRNELAENSFAHLTLLDPRNFLKAVRFAKTEKINGHNRKLNNIVGAYLKAKTANKTEWMHIAAQHKQSLKGLYALCHIKPSAFVDNILFKGKYPKGSIFEKIKTLKDMTAKEAASTILSYKIPFLVIPGALGAKIHDPDLVLALIERMSATELVTNSKMLEKLGVNNNPVLRSAYESGLTKVAESKKATFKTTKAIESVTNEKVKEKLRGAQEKQIKKLGGIEGDWLILGDCSSSMLTAVEASRHVSATLAKMVKGKVYLTFFNTSPRTFDVTGKDYDQILKETKNITANGWTSIGCGLRALYDKDIVVNGIAIVSDGEENRPPYFTPTYKAYAKKFDIEPVVYFYNLGNKHNALNYSPSYKFDDLEEFYIGKTNIDYYSLPNLVASMNTKRYTLIDQILDTPLLTINKALKGDFYVG